MQSSLNLTKFRGKQSSKRTHRMIHGNNFKGIIIKLYFWTENFKKEKLELDLICLIGSIS